MFDSVPVGAGGDNFNFAWGFIAGFDRTIRLPIMLNFQRAVRCREGAFNPLEVAEMGSDPDGFASGLKDLDTEHMFGEPGSGAGGPTMAKTVAEAEVAVIAIIAVDVYFTGGDQFIDAGRRFQAISDQNLPRMWWRRHPACHPSIAGYNRGNPDNHRPGRGLEGT